MLALILPFSGFVTAYSLLLQRARIAAAAFVLAVPLVASAEQLTVHWSDHSADEHGFIVERRDVAEAQYAPLAELGANVESYADSSVLPGSDYCYRVRAFNAIFVSEYTPETCSGNAPAPTPVTPTPVPVTPTPVPPPSTPLPPAPTPLPRVPTVTVPISVSLGQTAFSQAGTLDLTLQSHRGVVNAPVDVYVTVQGAGLVYSLQLDGRVVPGAVPMARGVVLRDQTLRFQFALGAVPVGTHAFVAGVTTPGSASLVMPPSTTPFTVTP